MTIVNDVDKTPVAQDILFHNPKEGVETWHVVVNHDANGYVDRVQCKMTGVIRKYKRKNKKSIVRKSTTRRIARTVSKQSSQSMEDQWFQGVKDWGNKIVPDYALDKSFDIGDVFSHPSFGKGVTQSRRDNKIDVLFKMGLKTLANKKS